MGEACWTARTRLRKIPLLNAEPIDSKCYAVFGAIDGNTYMQPIPLKGEQGDVAVFRNDNCMIHLKIRQNDNEVTMRPLIFQFGFTR